MFINKTSKKDPQTVQAQQLYSAIEAILSEAQIELQITRKRIKNINFRLKPYQLSVSAPFHVSDTDLIMALSKRVDWALNQHATLLKRQRLRPSSESRGRQAGLNHDLQPVKLWGKTQGLIMGEAERLRWYRSELQNVMPDLFDKWQPIVGKSARETRIKKMTTRWGSCNTRAKRIWLSVYLPAFPIECTEYVIVHELCHLHQANHSPAFWREVKRTMPNYKQWHDLLAGKSGSVD